MFVLHIAQNVSPTCGCASFKQLGKVSHPRTPSHILAKSRPCHPHPLNSDLLDIKRQCALPCFVELQVYLECCCFAMKPLRELCHNANEQCFAKRSSFAVLSGLRYIEPSITLCWTPASKLNCVVAGCFKPWDQVKALQREKRRNKA